MKWTKKNTEFSAVNLKVCAAKLTTRFIVFAERQWVSRGAGAVGWGLHPGVRRGRPTQFWDGAPPPAAPEPPARRRHLQQGQTCLRPHRQQGRPRTSQNGESPTKLLFLHFMVSKKDQIETILLAYATSRVVALWVVNNFLGWYVMNFGIRDPVFFSQAWSGKYFMNISIFKHTILLLFIFPLHSIQ